MAGRFLGPVRIFFQGDPDLSERYIGLGRAQMGKMLEFVDAYKLKQHVWRRTYPIPGLSIETRYVAPRFYTITIRMEGAEEEPIEILGHGFATIPQGQDEELLDIVKIPGPGGAPDSFGYVHLTNADSYGGRYPDPFLGVQEGLPDWVGEEDVLYATTGNVYEQGHVFSPMLSGYQIQGVCRYSVTGVGDRVFVAATQDTTPSNTYVFSRPYDEEGYTTAPAYHETNEPSGWKQDAISTGNIIDPTKGSARFTSNLTGNAMVGSCIEADKSLTMCDIAITDTLTVTISFTSQAKTGDTLPAPNPNGTYTWTDTPNGSYTVTGDVCHVLDFECFNAPYDGTKGGTPATGQISWCESGTRPGDPTCSELMLKTLDTITVTQDLDFNYPDMAFNTKEYLAAFYVGDERVLAHYEIDFNRTQQITGSKTGEYETEYYPDFPLGNTTYNSVNSSYSSNGAQNLEAKIVLSSGQEFHSYRQIGTLSYSSTCATVFGTPIVSGTQFYEEDPNEPFVVGSVTLDVRNMLVRDFRWLPDSNGLAENWERRYHDLLTGDVYLERSGVDGTPDTYNRVNTNGSQILYNESVYQCSPANYEVIGSESGTLTNSILFPASLTEGSAIVDDLSASRTIGERVMINEEGGLPYQSHVTVAFDGRTLLGIPTTQKIVAIRGY